MSEQTSDIPGVRSDLVNRDRGIPGLALLLEPELLVHRLSGHLDTQKIDAIQLDYLRYKPGMNCLARYRITLGNQVVLAHAKAHGSDAGEKIGKSLERPATDTELGPGRVVIDTHGVIFSLFPNDAKLASLKKLQGSQSRRRLLARVFGPASEWIDSDVADVLNYKPERRFVVRLESRQGNSMLAKFYSRNGYARAHAISRKLNKSGNSIYPETVGRSKKYRVVAYGWRPGVTLRVLNTQGRCTQAMLGHMAESLAAFHASSGKGLAALQSDGQAARLFALAEQLAVLLPGLSGRAEAMARLLSQWLKAQAPVQRPVHGDFYDKQVIFNGDWPQFIDFDAACLGNPLLDLGSYIAHLENLVSSYGASQVNVEEQSEILVSSYEKMTSPLDRSQLNRYIALALFGLIHHPFRSWVDDWPRKTESLLARVESLFS